jgi:hypothetical protein
MVVVEPGSGSPTAMLGEKGYHLIGRPGKISNDTYLLINPDPGGVPRNVGDC